MIEIMNKTCRPENS